VLFFSPLQITDNIRSILDTLDWILSARTDTAHPLFGKVSLTKGVLLAGHSLGASSIVYGATAAPPGSVAGLFGEASGNNQLCGLAGAVPFDFPDSPPGNCSVGVAAATLGALPHDLVCAHRHPIPRSLFSFCASSVYNFLLAFLSSSAPHFCVCQVTKDILVP
jgi:hypothetical protein